MSGRRVWRWTRVDLRDDVEAELRYHLDARIAELRAKGLSEADARAEAGRRMGDVDTVLRGCVESDLRRVQRVQRREYLRDVLQDVRQGARQLMRRPMLATVSVLTLGIGIGATSSIYAVADQVLIRPLPYEAPDRVVTIWETNRTSGKVLEVSSGNFVDWERSARSFSAMGLAIPYSVTLRNGDSPPVALETWMVSEGYFRALGVRPIVGRAFTPEEHAVGAAPVALMSHRMWQRDYGSDASITQRTVAMDGVPVRIVGVLPPSLEYPEHADIWTPQRFTPAELADRESNYMFAIGRLAPGVSVEAAQAELDLIAARLAGEYPATNRNSGVQVVTLREHVVGEMSDAVLVLLGAALFLLLIACANLANVLIARGMERGGELAVRSALGAGRARIARQLVTESFVVAGLGGVAGAALTWLGIRALLALAPPELPRVSAVSLDARVLVFIGMTTVATGLLFGLAPSLRISRLAPMSTLRGGRATPAREHTRLRGALLAVQIAMCVVLLIGTGLLARSMTTLLRNDLGFEREGRVSVQLFLWDNVPTADARVARVNELISRFEALPGVQRAAAVSSLPFHPHAITARTNVHVPGTPEAAPGDEPSAFATIATPGYFETLGIPLVAGRLPVESDRAGAPLVVWVNEAFASEFFPGENAVGRHVRVGAMSAPVEREIAGVVGNVRYRALDSEPSAEIYVPHGQSGNGSMTFIAHGSGDPAALANAMRDAVHDVDRTQPVYYTAPLEDLVAATLAQRRFQLTLAGVFAIIALALISLGIYAVVSLWARQRNHEFGVRIALGASAREIARLVLTQSLLLVFPGILAGTCAALLITRWIEHMLYGVSPTDAATFGNVTLLVVLIAAAAAWIPARDAASRPALRSMAD